MSLMAVISLSISAYAEQVESSQESSPSVRSETEKPGNSEEGCTHSFGSWTPAGDAHTRSCTLCGHTETAAHNLEEHTVTEASCTGAGSKTVSCGTCGYSRTEEIPASGHSYTLQNVDESNHKQVCSACGAEQLMPHAWSSQGLEISPSCTDAGTEKFGCPCGAAKTESVPAKGHSFGPWDGDETSHIRVCTACGKEESGAHSWDSGTVVLQPTCITQGVRGYQCSGCDMVLLEEIPISTKHTYDNDCDGSCNICGAVRDADHSYSKVYSKNSSGHWYTCRVCGEKINFQEHFPGPAATEEKAQLCLTCGYVMTARLNHVHNFQAEWVRDESGHWHACTGCEIQEDFQEHVYDDPCDPDCNLCGYQNQNPHRFEGNWCSDQDGHWDVCSLCGKESEKQPHIPDPESTESEPLRCSVCAFELAQVQQHVHMPGADWMTDEDNHWKICECGEVIDEAPHVWDAGTQTEDSAITYTCQICQFRSTEPIPQEKPKSSLWVIIFLGLLALAGIVAVAVLLVPSKKKQGRFLKR